MASRGSFLILGFVVLGLIACGPNSRHRPKRAQPQQEANKFSVEEENEPTLLPEEVREIRPRLPKQPPRIETPIEDEDLTPETPPKPIDPSLPEPTGDEPPPTSPPKEELPTPAPVPAPAPAPTPAEPAPEPEPEPQAPVPAPAPEAPPAEPPTAPEAPTPEPAPAPPERRQDVPTPSASTDAPLAKVQVFCEKKGARLCPNEVGLLVVKAKKRFTQCTSFLVGDRYLMTNSHCIPPALKEDGSDCRKHLQVFFPETDSRPAEYISCERVLRASKIAFGMTGSFGAETDYALLQLAQPTSRGHFEVSRDGVDDEMRLAFYAITPLEANDRMGGVLQARVCTAKQGALTSPSFVQPLAPVATVSGCAFVPGNSGSPGIDAQRRVRSILHAIVKVPTRLQGETEREPRFNPLALTTNLACTEIPRSAGAPLSANPHPDCAKKLTADDLIRKTLAKPDTRAIARMARKWRETAPRELEFEFRRRDDENSGRPLIAPVISCFKDPRRWSVSDKRGAGLSLKFDFPLWSYSLNLDSDDRLALTPEVVSARTADLKIDDGGAAILTITDNGDRRTQTFRERYPQCK